MLANKVALHEQSHQLEASQSGYFGIGTAPSVRSKSKSSNGSNRS